MHRIVISVSVAGAVTGIKLRAKMADSQPVDLPPKAKILSRPLQNHQSSLHEIQQSSEQANIPHSRSIARFFTTSYWRQKRFRHGRELPSKLTKANDEEEIQEIVKTENIQIMKAQVELYAKLVCKNLLKCEEDKMDNSRKLV